MSHNSISEIPGDIGLLTSLITLNISNNQIKSIKALSKMTSLRVLIANENQITSVKPICKLESLTTVIMSKNNLGTDSDVDKLSSLRNLEKVSFGKIPKINQSNLALNQSQ